MSAIIELKKNRQFDGSEVYTVTLGIPNEFPLRTDKYVPEEIAGKYVLLRLIETPKGPQMPVPHIKEMLECKTDIKRVIYISNNTNAAQRIFEDPEKLKEYVNLAKETKQ